MAKIQLFNWRNRHAQGIFLVIRENNLNLRIGQLQRLAPRDVSVRRVELKNDFTGLPKSVGRG
jgi:hypothetical protein